jgi:hypothetical protein
VALNNDCSCAALNPGARCRGHSGAFEICSLPTIRRRSATIPLTRYSPRAASLARHREIAFPDLPRGASQLAPADRLKAAVASAHVRERRVALRGRWWETDSGALVAFVEDGGTAVALLRTPGGYAAIDPLTGKRSRVDENFAAGLQYFAHSFFRAFPSRPLGALDVLRFAFAYQTRELFTIAAMAGSVGMLGIVVPIAIGIISMKPFPEPIAPSFSRFRQRCLSPHWRRCSSRSRARLRCYDSRRGWTTSSRRRYGTACSSCR